MTTLGATAIGAYALGAGLPLSAIPTAVAIAQAESNGDPNDDNGIAAGLWQINYHAHPQWTAAQLKNPATNAKAMVTISNGGKDWSAWSTHPTSTSRGISSSSGIARYNLFLKSDSTIDWGKLLPTGVDPNASGPITVPGGVNTITGGAADTATSLATAANAVSSSIAWLSDRKNLLRVGYVMLGGLAVIVAIPGLFPKATQAVQDTTKTVVKTAAKVGAVAAL